MQINQHQVMYVGVQGSVLDEIENSFGSSMSSVGQIMTNVETLTDMEPDAATDDARKAIAEILNYAGAHQFGGDIIIYKE